MSAKASPIVILVLAMQGCFGGPERIQAPDWDPSTAAAQALSLYDSNQDGALEGDELSKVPAIEKALAEIDLNRDKRVTEDELEQRMQGFVESRLGRMRFACRVLKNGRPLTGAKVIFDPEPFVADVIQPATGTVGPQGLAVMSIEGVDPPGITAGFYKVRITDPKVNLPAKYNSETTLGQELALGSQALSMGEITFNLK